MQSQLEQLPEEIAQLGGAFSLLRAEIGKAVIGQEAVIEAVLAALLAGGHCLLQGVPGLAKTLLVQSLGQALALDFRRVQFTPDLMPGDITGSDILDEEPGSGRRELRFIPGPVFTNLLLADEINRTPPKTQAALLEAMQRGPLRCRRRRWTASCCCSSAPLRTGTRRSRVCATPPGTAVRSRSRCSMRRCCSASRRACVRVR